MHKAYRIFSTLLFLLTLSACGGGGTTEVIPPPVIITPPGNQFTSSPEMLKQEVAITNQVSALTLDNSSALLSAMYEFMFFAGEQYFEFYSDFTWDPEEWNIRAEKQDCELKGNLEVKYSVENKVVTVFYNDCESESDAFTGTILRNGAQRTTWVDESADLVRITREYDELSVTDSTGTVVLNGVSDLLVSRAHGGGLEIVLNLQVTDSIKGVIRANDLKLDFSEHDQRNALDAIILGADGKIEYQDKAVVNVSSADLNNTILLNGTTNTTANLTLGESSVLFSFDEEGDGLRDRALFIDTTDEYNSTTFHTTINSTPIVRSDSNPYTVFANATVIGNQIEFDLSSYFTDAGGSLLSYTIELVRIEELTNDNVYSDADQIQGKVITDSEIVDYTLGEVEAARYSLLSYTPVEFAVYVFSVTAINLQDNATQEPLFVKVRVAMDTDADGQWDVNDIDDDNDGLLDHLDDLPKDPTETVDTDKDGIGNNADTDDDGDGVSDDEDVLPLDVLCAYASDIYEGYCLYSNATKQFIEDDFFMDNSGILYMPVAESKVIHRWNSVTQRFIEPLTLKPEDHVGTSEFYTMYYAAEQNNIYIHYRSTNFDFEPDYYSVITKINLDVGLQEEFFLDVTNLSIRNIFADSSSTALILRGLESGGTNDDYYSYSLSGTLIDTYFDVLDQFAPSSFYRQIDASPFCNFGFSVNQDTGMFFDIGSGSNNDDPCGANLYGPGTLTPVSPDGTRALIHEKGIIDLSQSLISTPYIWYGFHNLVWNDIGIFDHYYVDNEIRVYNKDGTLIDTISNVNSPQFVGRGDTLIYIEKESNLNAIKISVY